MNGERWGEVDRYVRRVLFSSDAALQEALRVSEEAGLPAIQVTPVQGKFLNLAVRTIGARNVLEVGTLGGYSTIWLARGLPEGGRVVTLEVDPRHAEVARANFARAGVAEIVEVRVGDAHETLPQLVAEGCGPFDFVFIDADKRSTAEYFEWAPRLSRVGTAIVIDNVVRAGSVADESSIDESVLGVRRALERIAAEPRVEATVLQTVGEKGYDGFALVLVVG